MCGLRLGGTGWRIYIAGAEPPDMEVLVPVDGSDPAAAAVEYALEQFGDEEPTALYVIDPVDGATAWGPGPPTTGSHRPRSAPRGSSRR